jgi:hypothetical protein
MFVNLDVLLLLGFPAYFKPQLIGRATILTKAPNGLIVLPRAPFFRYLMRLDNFPMAGVIEFQGEKKSRFQLVSLRFTGA